MTNPKNDFINIVTTSPTLQQIENKVEALAKLNRQLQEECPDLAQYCQVANLREGQLFLSTKTPALHHHLRFQTDRLLEAFKGQVHSVHILVDPKEAHAPQAPKASTLSSFSAEQLIDTASIIESEPLKKALERFAKHHVASRGDK